MEAEHPWRVEVQMDEKEFIDKASAANTFEIEAGKIAAAGADDDEVVDFAQMMIDDHTKAGEELRAALDKEGASAPRDRLERAQLEQLNRLRSMSGPELDAEYVRQQVVAHGETVDLFSKFAGSAEAGPVREFAEDTLPVLQRHQDAILDIFEDLGGDDGALEGGLSS
jgi:putative membrane protein